jgi:hypothetical protein
LIEGTDEGIQFFLAGEFMPLQCLVKLAKYLLRTKSWWWHVGLVRRDWVELRRSRRKPQNAATQVLYLEPAILLGALFLPPIIMLLVHFRYSM